MSKGNLVWLIWGGGNGGGNGGGRQWGGGGGGGVVVYIETDTLAFCGRVWGLCFAFVLGFGFRF